MTGIRVEQVPRLVDFHETPGIFRPAGKKRDELRVPKDADRETLERLALASSRVRAYLGDGAPRNVVVVPGRLVNVVV